MREVLDHFRWVNGHADVWRLFHSHEAFDAVTRALADPFRDANVTKVAGIEARGFVLGAAVARELGVGFVAIRKDSGLFPGPKLERLADPDYRQLRHTLRLQRDSLVPGDRVLLVDDWVEAGSQALAATRLVEAASAEVVGLAVVVDQASPEARERLPRLHALVARDTLGPDT